MQVLHHHKQYASYCRLVRQAKHGHINLDTRLIPTRLRHLRRDRRAACPAAVEGIRTNGRIRTRLRFLTTIPTMYLNTLRCFRLLTLTPRAAA